MNNALIEVSEAVEDLVAVHQPVSVLRAAVKQYRAVVVPALEKAGEHRDWVRQVRAAGVVHKFDSTAFRNRHPVEYGQSRVFSNTFKIGGPWQRLSPMAVDPYRPLDVVSPEYRDMRSRLSQLEKVREPLRQAVADLLAEHRDALVAAGAWHGALGVRYADGRTVSLGHLAFKRAVAEEQFPRLVAPFVVTQQVPETVVWRIRGGDEDE